MFSGLLKKARTVSPKPVTKRLILGLFFILALSAYFTFSIRFATAELHTDEVAYLNKGAAIAGYKVDVGNSWHAGYSIFLAPVFLIVNDPALIRTGVFLVNAALFAGSMLILFLVLEKLFPKRKFLEVLAATSISGLYPAWAVMTGYTFATPAFIFVFMASVWALIAIRSAARNIVAGVLTGFLFWIHPLGAAAIAAALFIFIYEAIRHREIRGLLIFLALALATVVIYYKGIHPLINSFMTSDGTFSVDHYAESLGRFSLFFEPGAWLNALYVAVGRLSYVLISTFGVIIFAAVYAVKNISKSIKAGKIHNSRNHALAYVVLAPLFILAFTSLSFGINAYIQSLNEPDLRSLHRVDHWVYGRYSDMALLPLIGIGLLSQWRYKYVFITVALVLMTGVLLDSYVAEENTTLARNFMLSNIPSYWPWAVYQTVDFMKWSILGALGILIVGLLRRRFGLLVAIPLAVITMYAQGQWHRGLVFSHSNVYAATQIIRNNGANTCIGFDMALLGDYHKGNKLRVYSFYLYDSNLHRQSVAEWMGSKCGFYITDDPSTFVSFDNVQPVFRDDDKQLFLLAKTDQVTDLRIKDDLGIIYANKNYPRKDDCVVRGCFSRKARHLKDTNFNFIAAGTLIGGDVITNGSEGYLFYGPYLPLQAGSYKLIIRGQFMNPKGAILEVVSTEPAKLIYESEIHPFISNNVLEIPFIVREDSLGVEVRLKVSSETEVMISGYEINLN